MPKPDSYAAPAPLDAGLIARLSQDGSPFWGVLDPVTVEAAAGFSFAGCLTRTELAAFWRWAVRDLAPQMFASGEADPGAFAEAVTGELIGLMRKAEAAALARPEAARVLVVQLGGEEMRARLAVLIAALKCRAALGKARRLGHAINTMADDAALDAALGSIPRQDAAVTALLMHAMTADVDNPSRLVLAATRLGEGASDISITRSGYGPMIEALLAHAQNQLPLLDQRGPFADVDLICTALDRFHRLVRAVTGYVEMSGRSRWLAIAGGLTRRMSDLLAPRLKAVVTDIGQAMRRRERDDRLDPDLVLAALNGCYLMKTARDCRDSLALNGVIDQAWVQAGQALELLLDRHLTLLRDQPGDLVTAARVDAAIKMAELRFGTDYAEVMRRARLGAERRSA